MSTINGFDSNSMSSLFSSMGTSSTSSSSDGLYGINLSDYASIKNGSYGKLMKSYYAMDEEASTKDKKSKNDTDDTDATIRSIKSASDDLKDSAAALYSSKGLFAQDANGEYDMDAIYEKVNAFIEDYNSMIGSVGSAETESIAKAGGNIVNATSNNMDMLSKLGISVSGADFTLSIDKEKFMKSNISDVKSMFSGVGSFAYQVGAKASRIYTMVEDKVSSGSAYKSSKSETSNSTSKDTANTIAKIKERADDLIATGTDLYKNRDLFDKDYDGEYNTNEIVEEIGAFIKDYNDLIISAENTKSSGIESAMKTLESITDAYKKDLASIGITVDKEDGTLSFDEESFLNSDMKDVKSLFIGTGSFTYQATVKATMVANQAETEANKSNTYTDNATYGNNYNTGSIFDGTI
ncbi:MAG: flagellar filament capping protein FliD [Agathobacter sp.]|nr:flagellar filament capping protein FliD [Agathobacter sp.]